VTCSGGTIQNGGTAHITINTNAPSLNPAQYPTCATVNPDNTIAERDAASNTNNTSCATLSDVYIG
jgi:hypothetical protein